MLNLCQLVWECWGENQNAGTQHGMLLFDLDQWYKDQMPGILYIIFFVFMNVFDCKDLQQWCLSVSSL